MTHNFVVVLEGMLFFLFLADSPAAEERETVTDFGRVLEKKGPGSYYCQRRQPLRSVASVV